jgi:phage terminase Nu1 subunit (DNA packaging protein)
MTTKTAQRMTQAAYARRIGVDPSYVYRLKTRGVIELTDDGMVNALEADAAIAAHRDPSKPLQRKGRPDGDALVIHQGDFAKTGQNRTDGALPDDEGPQNWNELYLKSRAIKERELARSAKMKADAEQGLLVDAAQVALDFAHVATLVRQKMEGIPSRLSAQLAAARSEAEVRRLLTTEIHHALTALADGLEAGGADE